VSRARTLSETVGVQERLLDKALDAFTAFMERPARGADEKVTLKRNSKGETQPEIECVRQDGESFAQMVARARVEYERLCARYPTPNGAAHAAPLGDDAP
jgi:hypothetical protein